MAIYWTFMFLIGLVFCQVPEPETSIIETMTVQEGESAELTCTIKFKGNYRVLWMRADSAILTDEDRRVIDDPRISVDEWTLHIRSVTLTDQGLYTCQLNTNPVRSMSVNLLVKVD